MSAYFQDFQDEISGELRLQPGLRRSKWTWATLPPSEPWHHSGCDSKLPKQARQIQVGKSHLFQLLLRFFCASCPSKTHHRHFRMTSVGWIGPTLLWLHGYDVMLDHIGWPSKPLWLNPTENMSSQREAVIRNVLRRWIINKTMIKDVVLPNSA